jgi:hypothetical protein
MESLIGFALGSLAVGLGIYAGFRLGRLGLGEVPRLTPVAKVSGYFPTQEDMDDASESE